MPDNGIIQADAYNGYDVLMRATSLPGVVRVAWWAHARRTLYDVHEATILPIAKDGLRRVGELYDIERAVTGTLAEQRLAARREHALPKVADLRA